jgi:phage baseplate assembly protein W
MAIFIGFSTASADAVRKTQVDTGADGGSGSMTNPIITNRKFRTVDEQLVLRDFLNALNIPQGQKPGNPKYGTTLWSFVFEPNTLDVQAQLESEIRRVASTDSRMILSSVIAYPQEGGILLEIEMSVTPFNNVERLSIMFDQGTSRATSV